MGFWKWNDKNVMMVDIPIHSKYWRGEVSDERPYHMQGRKRNRKLTWRLTDRRRGNTLKGFLFQAVQKLQYRAAMSASCECISCSKQHNLVAGSVTQGATYSKSFFFFFFLFNLIKFYFYYYFFLIQLNTQVRFHLLISCASWSQQWISHWDVH